ncbi:TetR/AcrR family transcriptional regulator [Paraburkholderia sp. J63]|uniref:TetR/AcrR family transcriptional regulator n=1 Tax=Paraburkholderia sp. J63 TaxID=2805434 RepID=UPI002ABE9EB6|nr:TetR/AcrR family transcriptional regulator [Paraburkholderia sp. J63]
MKALHINSADLLGETAPPRVAKRGNRGTRIPEILDVSARVFARDGHASFTTRRVAAEVGIRLSTLQHYFSTREELLHATIGALIDRYAASFAGVTSNRHLPPEARLDALMEVSFSEFSKPEVAAFWVEVWAMARNEAFARELETKAYQDGTKIVEDLIAEINPACTQRECAIRAGLIAMLIEGLFVLVRRYPAGGVQVDELLVAAKAVYKGLSRVSP